MAINCISYKIVSINNSGFVTQFKPEGIIAINDPDFLELGFGMGVTTLYPETLEEHKIVSDDKTEVSAKQLFSVGVPVYTQNLTSCTGMGLLVPNGSGLYDPFLAHINGFDFESDVQFGSSGLYRKAEAGCPIRNMMESALSNGIIPKIIFSLGHNPSRPGFLLKTSLNIYNEVASTYNLPPCDIKKQLFIFGIEGVNYYTDRGNILLTLKDETEEEVYIHRYSKSPYTNVCAGSLALDCKGNFGPVKLI